MGLLSMFSGAPKKPNLPNMPQVQQPQQPAPQKSDFMHVMSYHGPLNRALATRPSMIEQYKAGTATPPAFLRPEDYSFMGITPAGIKQGNKAIMLLVGLEVPLILMGLQKMQIILVLLVTT
jgi:hypothetical protein